MRFSLIANHRSREWESQTIQFNGFNSKFALSNLHLLELSVHA